jgi:hypothetical protein
MLRSAGIYELHLRKGECTLAKDIMNPYGKVFAGEGIKIECAYFKEKNKSGLYDVLIRVRGKAAVDEGIEGKVMHLVATPGGTGVDYTYKANGKTLNRMSQRKNWNYESWEIYVSNESKKVFPDETLSSDFKPLHLLTEFEEQTNGKKKKAA